jgi:hypothetical protein
MSQFSGKTMSGDLPPSSRVTVLIETAAFFMMCPPVGTEPVKAIFCTCGWCVRGAPQSTPWPLMMLTTLTNEKREKKTKKKTITSSKKK